MGAGTRLLPSTVPYYRDTDTVEVVEAVLHQRLPLSNYIWQGDGGRGGGRERTLTIIKSSQAKTFSSPPTNPVYFVFILFLLFPAGCTKTHDQKNLTPVWPKCSAPDIITLNVFATGIFFSKWLYSMYKGYKYQCFIVSRGLFSPFSDEGNFGVGGCHPPPQGPPISHLSRLSVGRNRKSQTCCNILRKTRASLAGWWVLQVKLTLESELSNISANLW